MRVSRTVLREARGEIPLVYSPQHRVCPLVQASGKGQIQVAR